ncbi:MAG: OB-fold nucleic acid binding domain-containing protein, partial [Microcoleus sp.]
KLGIEVEPPDVNSSEVNFTPRPKKGTREAKDKIMFGLSAVKNIGEGAIENILAARQEGGKFKSLPDFCDRVNLQSVNKRALEALINCGAFDKIDKNRKKLSNALESVMKWASDRKKDRESGQGNLFDFMGGTGFGSAANTYDSAPQLKDCPDFDVQTKLQSEKELLGFYVSEHPLKSLLQIYQDKDVVTIGELEAKKGKVSVIITIASIKPVVTKKDSRRMAILQIEDLTGKCEAVVFPDTFEKIGALIVDNAILLIEGKIDKREDQFQIIVENAKLLDGESLARKVDLEISENESDEFDRPIDVEVTTEIATEITTETITQITTEAIETETPEIAKKVEKNSFDRTVNFVEVQKEDIKIETPQIVKPNFEQPVNSVNHLRSPKPSTTLQIIIVKFTPEQLTNSEKLTSLKYILQEFSAVGEDAGVLVAGIAIGKYSCQPFWMGRQLRVENAEETVSSLKSTGFEAGVFSVNNDAQISAFQEVRSQLNLHSWASSLLKGDRAKLEQYLHYLAQFEPPW